MTNWWFILFMLPCTGQLMVIIKCVHVAWSVFSHQHVLPESAAVKIVPTCKQSWILPALRRCSCIITTSSSSHDLRLSYICLGKIANKDRKTRVWTLRIQQDRKDLKMWKFLMTVGWSMLFDYTTAISDRLWLTKGHMGATFINIVWSYQL